MHRTNIVIALSYPYTYPEYEEMFAKECELKCHFGSLQWG